MSKPKQQAKHGIWFDFIRHMQIHRSVLAGWSSCMVNPQTYSENIAGDTLELQVKFQFAVNGYEVEIQKFGKIAFTMDVGGNKVPHQVRTETFGYSAFNQVKGHSIRICSPHEFKYNPNYPWHTKHHRHDIDTSGELITIYSEDDRPIYDKIRFGHKYMSGGKQVKVQYTDQTWPHLSEFFSETFKLP